MRLNGEGIHHQSSEVRKSESIRSKNMATFECRVQYLDDTDPFSSTNFPEPTRPPSYIFHRAVPLLNQIGGVHKLLGAPHKVSWRQTFLWTWFQVTNVYIWYHALHRDISWIKVQFYAKRQFLHTKRHFKKFIRNKNLYKAVKNILQ